MIPLILAFVLAAVGLAGAYWFLHQNQAVSQFWELAGIGVLMMFLLIGVSFIVRATARGRKR